MADYADMSLREELETRFADAERCRQEEEMLSRGWQPPSRLEEVSGLQRKQTIRQKPQYYEGLQTPYLRQFENEKQRRNDMHNILPNFVNPDQENSIEPDWRDAVKQNVNVLINPVKALYDSGYGFGELAADTEIAVRQKNEMDRVGRQLVNKFGRGAGVGIDDYYHSLLQCHLVQMGPESRENGIMLGYGKEARDYIVKLATGMKHYDVVADSSKDLRNNEYGSKVGAENPNRSCTELLNHLRTRNMKNERYY